MPVTVRRVTRRSDPDSLARSLQDPGFTPSVRDAAALFEALASDDETREHAAERALVRLGPALVARAAEQVKSSEPALRARICRVVGKVDGPEAAAFLLGAMGDADPKTRRNAIVALGRVRTTAAELSLLEAWSQETRVEQLRSIAASLGKIGTPRALEALRARTHEDLGDAELARILGRALTMLERDAKRTLPSAIDGSCAPKKPMLLVLRCREGLEELLVGELGRAFKPHARAKGEVEAILRGPLADVLRARIATSFGFALPAEQIRDESDLPDAVARALTSRSARAIFTTFTTGVARYRLAWTGGGHRRALVWSAAARVSALWPELVNDPTGSTWEARISVKNDQVHAELLPRALPDTRFAYRLADVPAASHPTLAAALVRVAGVRPEDIVWDPFVGSATELIERAIAGPYAELHGSDVEPSALASARKNLEKAGIGGVHLRLADAFTYAPEGVSLILTNPPMGRRVQKQGELGPFLDRFVAHAATALIPGGRLVWISPQPGKTRARARAAGLEIQSVQKVDMGGFTAEIQSAVRKT